MDHLTNEYTLKLREASAMMRQILQSISTASARVPVTATAMASLCSTLGEVRQQGLLAKPSLDGDELFQERALYMENLKKLYAALPALHVHLRMMQSRLGRNRNHMSAVSGWLSASRDVL